MSLGINPCGSAPAKTRSKPCGVYIQVLFTCKKLKPTPAPPQPRKDIARMLLISVVKGALGCQATSQLMWQGLSSSLQLLFHIAAPRG